MFVLVIVLAFITGGVSCRMKSSKQQPKGGPLCADTETLNHMTRLDCPSVSAETQHSKHKHHKSPGPTGLMFFSRGAGSSANTREFALRL